jgi:hypothetical protein
MSSHPQEPEIAFLTDGTNLPVLDAAKPGSAVLGAEHLAANTWVSGSGTACFPRGQHLGADTYADKPGVT